MPNRRRLSVVASCMALLAPCIVRACTIIPTVVQVGRNFRVRVTDRGQPVEGLRLVLRSQGAYKPVADSTSDNEGYAYFSNLYPGSLWLSPDRDDGMESAIIVDISDSALADTTVALGWPSRSPLSVRSASGIIRGPEYYPKQVQPPLSLSLLEGISGREIETTQSDNRGRFTFTNIVHHGIYFLRLNPSGIVAWDGERIRGTISIEISAAASRDALDLDIGWTSCGLSYAEQVKEPELRLQKICGDIADTEGATVVRALVSLLGDGDDAKIFEEAKTSPMGKFVLQEQHEGTYQLIVRSPGFQPSVHVIHLDPTKSGYGCAEPVHIRLAIE